MSQVASPITEERSRLLTLVFTDLVNSVGLKTRLGDADAGRLIAAHYEGLREACRVSGGREILSAGDGSFLTFETPSQAVDFALKLQDFEAANPRLPAVRIGIHMGEVTERLQPAHANRPVEIEGLAVDLASRIQNLAAARQILMSYPVFDNARQRLNANEFSRPIEWRAHGRYVFQGADAGLEIFEAGLKDLSPFNPPAGSTKAHRDVHTEDESTLGWRPAQALDLPGRPNWELVEKLGEGGFGDVWLAQHRKTHESHVIKFCYSTDRLRALKREVTLFRLLKESLGDRADIARVIDYQFDAPPYFIEMEFAGHHTLTSWIEEQGGADAIPLAVRIEIVAQVADAIAAAHSVGVLHKDIKPSNIMITESSSRPRIRMIDFGIGAVEDISLLNIKGITATGLTETSTSSERAASLTGTRLYMAPELIEGKAATTKSDIYSLGVVLYQMASGKLHQTLSIGWERDVPDELLREDIQACVDGNPENRIISAEDLAIRLRNLPERRVEREERVVEIKRGETARKRRRYFYFALALATVLLIFFAQFAMLQKQKADTAITMQKRAESAKAEALKQADMTKDALHQAELANYFGAIALAEAGLREHRYEKVQDVLFGDAPVAYRHREWGWLLAQTSPENFSIRHGNILDSKFSADGKSLIAGSRITTGDGYIRSYSLADGSFTSSVLTNNRLVWNIAISPDGRTAATASSDRTVSIVDLYNSKVVNRLTTQSAIVRDVAFSPDGKTLAVCARNNTISFWPTSDYKTSTVITIPGDSFSEIAFSPDGKYLVSGSLESNVRVFDVATATEVATLEGHTGQVLSVDFLENNTGIITASNDGHARKFDWPPAVGETMLSPTLTLRSPESYPSQVHSGPAGKSFYVGNDNGTIRKIDSRTGQELRTVQVDQPLWKMDVSADGTKMLTTARWTTRLLDLDRLEAESKITEWTDPLTVPLNSIQMKVATVPSVRDTTWKADIPWRTTSGLTLVQVKDAKYFVQSAYRIYSPDRTQMLRWDAKTQQCQAESTLNGKRLKSWGDHHISTAVFSPDGSQAALADTTSGTVVYDTKNWKFLYSLPRRPNGSTALHYSNDGKTLYEGNVDGFIIIARASDGFIEHTINASGGAVFDFDVSSDGNLLAAGLDADRATVIDLRTNDIISTMSGHVRYVHGVKFTPASDRLVTLSRDGTVKLWDIKSGRELVTLFNLPQPESPLAVTFSQNGRFISIATSQRKIETTEIFPWNIDTYGDGPEPIYNKVELWKRKQRMDSNITMDAVYKEE